MARRRKQIDDDARAAAASVRAAGRPLRLSEIAEALRRRGIPQTDKQARITAIRALEFGLLRRRDKFLWEFAAAGTHSVAPLGAAAEPASPQLAVYCAWRLLEMPPSVSVARKARSLLEEAMRQLPPVERATVAINCAEDDIVATLWDERPEAAASSNGGGDGGPSTLEVLLAADS